ncbi:MAG: four helix bundle protein [Opitutales bacterium]|nr:four helix bundle protein [Opitutales bacterium]
MNDLKFGFEKLIVWQKARALYRKLYEITKNFPSSEKFGLVERIRRASVSVASNIAEGSSRASYKERERFLEIAYGR